MFKRNLDFVAILVLVLVAGVLEMPRLATRVAHAAMERKIMIEHKLAMRETQSRAHVVRLAGHRIVLTPESPSGKFVHFE